MYFDNAATTRLDPEVLKDMLPYLEEECGNPSSGHAMGRRAKRALEFARKTIGLAIGARPGEVVFTAGGTESDNLALLGCAQALGSAERNEIVISAIEHPAVLNIAPLLERNGFVVRYAPVTGGGILDLEAFGQMVGPRTLLVSVMLVNNELGTIQPIPEVARLAHRHDAFVHTDAVQAFGKIPVDVDDLGVDMLSLSSHKIHGPQGVGGLYIRRGTPLQPRALGGGQESGRRSGTENLAGIVGFASAARLAADDMENRSRRILRLRQLFESRITALAADAWINGNRDQRVSNITNATLPNASGDFLLRALSEAGVFVSSGSACASVSLKPSHVLTAIGLDARLAQATLRFSFSDFNTRSEVERTLEILAGLLAKAESMPGTMVSQNKNDCLEHNHADA